jgi:hypothetical protein
MAADVRAAQASYHNLNPNCPDDIPFASSASLPPFPASWSWGVARGGSRFRLPVGARISMAWTSPRRCSGYAARSWKLPD